MAEIDIDAILAAEDEARGEPHKITWAGETFAVPRIMDWPAEVFDLITEGKVASALAQVMADEWDGFYEARKPTVAAAEAILEGIVQAEGFKSLGESRASLSLSNRATRRSKLTSSGSTESTS